MLYTFILGLIMAASAATQRPKALVYRGPSTCNGCPESVKNLLVTSPSNFEVSFVGPREDIKINADALSQVDVFAFPGGGPLSKAARNLKDDMEVVRSFVKGGGTYMGFCLGAYMAGSPGFDILPPGYHVNEECIQSGAEVQNRSNTMIQVDWKWSNGSKAGSVEKRWMFFQDGSVVLGHEGQQAEGLKVLARYSSNGDIAATLSPYGNGRVGTVGPHPEADKSWCEFRKCRFSVSLRQC
jgi:glutamine amidotransferase-like uncharacterized protein